MNKHFKTHKLHQIKAEPENKLLMALVILATLLFLTAYFRFLTISYQLRNAINKSGRGQIGTGIQFQNPDLHQFDFQHTTNGKVIQ